MSIVTNMNTKSKGSRQKPGRTTAGGPTMPETASRKPTARKPRGSEVQQPKLPSAASCSNATATMKIRDKLLKRARATKLDSDWLLLVAKRKEVRSMLKDAEIKFVQKKIIECQGKPGAMWKIIRNYAPRAATFMSQADRLNVVSQNTTERVASETPEQRAERLGVLSENAATRIQSETPEQQADRLNVVRQNTTERVPSETAGERERRFVSVRTNLEERIENESVPEREERRERRATKKREKGD